MAMIGFPKSRRSATAEEKVALSLSERKWSGRKSRLDGQAKGRRTEKRRRMDGAEKRARGAHKLAKFGEPKRIGSCIQEWKGG